MNNGIIQTALTGLPLELEYRPQSTHYEGSTISEPFLYSAVPSRQSQQGLSEEFECLVRMI